MNDRMLFRRVVQLVCAWACVAMLGGMEGCDKHAKQKQDIKAAWKTYNDAAEGSDGPAMGGILTKNVLDRYDRLLKTALDGKSSEVQALDPIEQRYILIMRNRATKKQLKGYNGKGIVIYGVNQGWWSGFGADEWKLTSIRVNGDGAEAKITEIIPEYSIGTGYRASLRQSMRSQRDRKPREYPVRFLVEDGVWKLDTTTLASRFNEELQAASKAYRMSMRDFLMSWEEDESGKEVTFGIWEPMK